MKRNVIITGASGNLGKAAVLKFLTEGYRVIAITHPGKPLDYPVTGEVIEIQVDLTHEQAVQEMIDKCVSKYEQLDAVLLLAGGFASGNITETDSDAIKEMMALNFETAYHVVRPVFAHMMKQETGGRILMIGARPALVPNDGKNMLAYALSKSLLFKLADFMNAEGSSHNVLTSVIVPSIIDTPTNREYNPTADFSAWVKPEEIAEVMAFLSSEKSRTLRDTVVKMYGNA
jgi:NAD(P)-dependent dehydrogenase (short-subunit alcohol dehydrogenase family)